jgi:hypothetical protein
MSGGDDGARYRLVGGVPMDEDCAAADCARAVDDIEALFAACKDDGAAL